MKRFAKFEPYLNKAENPGIEVKVMSGINEFEITQKCHEYAYHKHSSFRGIMSADEAIKWILAKESHDVMYGNEDYPYVDDCIAYHQRLWEAYAQAYT